MKQLTELEKLEIENAELKERLIKVQKSGFLAISRETSRNSLIQSHINLFKELVNRLEKDGVIYYLDNLHEKIIKASEYLEDLKPDLDLVAPEFELSTESFNPTILNHPEPPSTRIICEDVKFPNFWKKWT